MKKIGTFLAAAAVLAAVVTGCDSSGSTTQTTDTAAASENTATEVAGGPTLTIANMAFGQPLTVAPGTQINIANNDTVEHSVTSDTKGAFDVHVDGGKRKTLTAPSQPGEYAFYCVYHPNMKGTLIVK
jgi:plastocyanin